MPRAAAVLAMVILGLLAGCGPASEPPSATAGAESVRIGEPSVLNAERDGLLLEARMEATATELKVEAAVRNGRDTAVHLVPTQCGRIIEVILARTVFEPKGDRWTGSIGAAKQLILDDQRRRQDADRFLWAERPDPGCFSRPPPIRLGPGDLVVERWELELTQSRVLDEVGSDGSAIRIEVVEAAAADRPEYLDFSSAGLDDETRAGRNVRIEQPASLLVRAEPAARASASSLGELFDRFVSSSPELLRWIEDQPPDSWREAELYPAYPEAGRLTAELQLITSRYERAAKAVAEADGSVVSLRLPGRQDSARRFPRRSASLPPGIEPLSDDGGWAVTEDLLLPRLQLPSGRLVVGEYLLDTEGMVIEISVPKGRYPVRATLARYEEHELDTVALASLVISDAPTARWELLGGFPVDGGTAAFISLEGRDALLELFHRDEQAWTDFWLGDVADSLTAHDRLATERVGEGGHNLIQFSSGVGDGAYPVYVGYDAAGRATRVVVDFLLLDLGWPDR